MSDRQQDGPGVQGSAVAVAGALTVMIAITVGTRLAGSEISGRNNSLLALAGVAGVTASSWALWTRGSAFNRGALVSVIVLALSGIVALGLVNLDLFGETGVVVTTPFLVPIVLALLRMKR